MRRSSLLASLSDKAREDRLVVVDELSLDPASTREMAKCLDALGVGPPILLVGDGTASEVLRAVRNIPRVKMLPSNLLNTIDVVRHRTVVMTLEAVRKAEEMWGGPFARRKPKDAAPEPKD
jgi:large subunit ribosomal protein L4